jgi:hypothetical protein
MVANVLIRAAYGVVVKGALKVERIDGDDAMASFIA